MEKQIEEMAKVIDEMDERNAHYYDEDMRECEAFADANAIARVLYNAGYRKQKEIAKEIFDAIKEKLIFNTYGIATISSKTFCELKKKYTGEKEDEQIH